MKNYFYLQLKRVAKVLPFILTLTIVLQLLLTVILGKMMDKYVASEQKDRFAIAVAGDTDNMYMQFGIAALQNYDETKFSIEFVEMDEKTAQKSLEKGDVSAYIVIPENFVENSLLGKVDPIKLVTSAGIEGVTGLLKKEITTQITRMAIYSQKGVYGIYDALTDNGLQDIANKHQTNISVKYTELVFHRNELYSVEEIGVSDGLSTLEYYVCAIIIVFFVLAGIPFAITYIKNDYSFNRLLLSRGCSTARQIVLEYFAHFIAMLVLTSGVIIFAVITLKEFAASSEIEAFKNLTSDIVIKIIPIVAMLSAFNLFMFEISDNIVSGMLLHFFVVISLCYVSGCLYPIYVFPDAIKKIAKFLPTGMARSYLATSFTFENSWNILLGLAIYLIAFLLILWFVRYQKAAKTRR